MFPNGWPGCGLLLLRLVAGILMVHDGFSYLLAAPQWEGIIRQSIAVGAGILLLLGLWTPIATTLVVIVELWLAVSRADSLRSCVLLASLGAALLMLGPGVWSIDARLFGRKRIDIRDPKSGSNTPQ
jgi:putative oxidoreductase